MGESLFIHHQPSFVNYISVTNQADSSSPKKHILVVIYSIFFKKYIASQYPHYIPIKMIIAMKGVISAVKI
jgi:hypothetical protein